MKTNANTAKADDLATAASRAAVDANATDGRIVGWLSIAAAPGAVLISPAIFSLIAFAIALFGLTIAAPQQRKLSIVGIVLGVVCGAIGFYFKTPIV